MIHVARLARLDLTTEEIDRFTAQLSDVLNHVSDIEALDVGDIPPTSHPVALVNVFRLDELRPSLNHDEVLNAAPAVENGRFRVPPILDDKAANDDKAAQDRAGQDKAASQDMAVQDRASDR